MRYAFLFMSVALSLVSCTGQNKNDSTIQPLPEIRQVTVKIQRFDKDFYQYLNNPDQQKQRELSVKYKDFLPAFGRITINNSDSYKTEFYQRLQKYFSNQMLSDIYKSSIDTFKDVSVYEKELSYADYLITENFSGRHLPVFNMHVSGFKENVMVLENMISLSIDKYLGENFPAYKQFFEPYQLIQMQPKMVSRDYIKAWLLSEQLITVEGKKTLLTEMVSEGKVMYILSQLLPQWSQEDLIGYKPDQLKWCEDNEKQIWNSIISQNHLYDSNYLTIQKYINDAPYTTNLSPESPGRVGVWVGWQIVKSYVSKNNTSLSDLLSVHSQQILKGSGYNP